MWEIHHNKIISISLWQAITRTPRWINLPKSALLTPEAVGHCLVQRPRCLSSHVLNHLILFYFVASLVSFLGFCGPWEQVHHPRAAIAKAGQGCLTCVSVSKEEFSEVGFLLRIWDQKHGKKFLAIREAEKEMRAWVKKELLAVASQSHMMLLADLSGKAAWSWREGNKIYRESETSHSANENGRSLRKK